MSRFKYQVRQHVSPTVAPLSAAIGLALSATSLQAATITVTTLNDGSVPGQCTLRDALVAANGDSAVAGCSAGMGADNIVFQPGLSGTLNLTGGYLPISTPVTVTGPGPDQIRIVGDGTDRLIASSSTTTEISGLRLENGYINDSFGGAALAAVGSDVRLSNCEIVGNASGPTSYGGAIVAVSSLLEIDQCTLSGNTVEGVILLRGGSYAFGGGVLAVTSEVTISGSTFENNGADLYGGGLALIDATASISNSSFTDNEALIGGAISLGDTSLLTMSDSFITSNTAYAGGGLVVGSQSYAGLSNVELYGNNAIDTGGGALIGVGYAPPVILPEPSESENRGGGLDYSLTGPGALAIEDSRIAFNSANEFGGGLAAKYDSGVQVFATDVAYNDALVAMMPLITSKLGRGGGGPTSEGYGGGLATLNEAYIEVSDSYIRSNRADFGGGGFAGYGELLIEDSVVSSNEATIGGGLLAGTEAPPSTPLNDPQTRGGTGPGTTGQVEVYNSLVADNRANYGGGVASFYGGVAGVAESNVSENVAYAGGGGLLAYESALISTNTVIADNTAYRGGGVWTEGVDSSVIISGAWVRGNSATYAGGLALQSGFDRLKYSLVDDNSAVTVGGVFMSGPPSADSRIVNSTVTRNTAETVGGLFTDLATLEFVTISDNSATVALMPPDLPFNSRGLTENPGGAVLSGDVAVNSSIFSDNVSPGGTLDLSFDSPGVVTIDYSLIESPGAGVGAGTGNLIGLDPQLGILAANGGTTLTRALGPGSPARDSGDPTTSVINDQRGQPYPRVFNGRADMGAFEFIIDDIFDDRFEQP